MREWREVQLGSHITHKKGFAFKSKDYQNNGRYIVRVSNTTSNSVDTSSCVCIDEKKAQEFSAYELLQKDIVIMTVGSWPDNPASVVGKVIRVPKEAENALLNQNAVRIRANNKIHNDFLYFLLKNNHFSKYLVANAQGSANQASITLDDIFSYSFLSPPLTEQKAIASVLSSLDDKIDLLHRQNKTLEAMAETLFRQWFIENEEGDEIRITEIINFNPRENLTKGSMADYLEMASVQTSSFHPINWYKREFNSGTKFKNNDTLFARITPCLENGKTCYVTFLEKDSIGWGSTEFIVMRAKDGFHPFITYTLSKNQTFREYAEGCMEGSSGRQRVNTNHLKEFTIVLPDEKKLSTIKDNFTSITQRLHHNFFQIKKLELLRDTLLPKLMSGEVRINHE